MRTVLFLLAATLAIAGEFTTSIGDTYPYQVSAVATDSAGYTYVVGSRQLATSVTVLIVNGAVPPAVTSSNYGGSDVFVTKLDPNGNVLFTDIFAGKGVDTCTAIALDPAGNIYIAGNTTSPDFPLTKALQTQPNPSSSTGFIIKLTNDGSTVLYSTYFGGTLGGTSITSLAADSTGNLYLTGITTAADFPHTAGMPFGPSPIQALNSGAILSCISAAGDKILYSGVLTGGVIPISGGDVENAGGVGVAVDAAGNAYFTGNTGVNNLPTTSGVLAPTGSDTGFLAKVSTASGSLTYLTYLPSFVYALAVDPAGDAYLAGYIGGNINAPIQVSLTKINPSASAVLWTTNLGGADGTIQSIAVDASNNVWATGNTSSLTFPNTNGWTTGPEFLVGLNSTGSKLIYSALYPSGTVAQSVAVDPSGLVHVAGSNGFVSAIAPSTPPTMKIFGFQNAAGGNLTARISPAEVISIYGPGIGPSTAQAAAPVSGFYPKTFAGVQVTLNGANIPLLYVSANQINAVVPMGLTTGVDATIRVINGANVSPGYPVWLLASAPQAFPTVLNQDGTINSQTNPAKGGSIVTFYGTGWQSSFSPLTDGQVATTAQNVCQFSAPVVPPPATGTSVGIGPSSCQVDPAFGVYAPQATLLYAGSAPGIVAGVSQFNVQIGAVAMSNFAFGSNYFVIGTASIEQTIWVAY